MLHSSQNVSLRPVAETDERKLWEWRNEALARSASANSCVIPYAQHHEWFKQALGDQTIRIFIVLNASGAEIGYVRFSIANRVAEISVAIDANCRGCGFGSTAIKCASELLFNDAVSQIVARVRVSNDPSIRAFERAGFQQKEIEDGFLRMIKRNERDPEGPQAVQSNARTTSPPQAASVGAQMYSWANYLFPICRSLTGSGNRETLDYIRKLVPELNVYEVPSGTRAFDWIVPDEWQINEAHITDELGTRILDFKRNNLHVVGYSIPVDLELDLAELDKHLYSRPDLPDAIPYVTSYYHRTWGFCLAHRQRQRLKSGLYRVVIDSRIFPGSLTYGEIILPGREQREVLLSTYICHPSMANNELSGPVVTTALAQYLAGMRDRRFTYRIVFIPETIGSIVYLSRNLAAMKGQTAAGFVITCCGDDRTFSFMPSREGNTLADRIALHALKSSDRPFQSYSYLQRGSDERQYCSPGVDLPVASIMRSKYATYPEYHTSLDDMRLICASGLQGSYDLYRTCIEILENNYIYKSVVLCEPQMSTRNLYPALGARPKTSSVTNMMNMLAYCDGTRDLIAVADEINCSAVECATMAQILKSEGLIRVAE